MERNQFKREVSSLLIGSNDGKDPKCRPGWREFGETWHDTDETGVIVTLGAVTLAERIRAANLEVLSSGGRG